jgi:bacterioferritin
MRQDPPKKPAPGKTSSSKGPFVADVEGIRARARKDLAKGAVTPGYRGDPRHVVDLLNHALATEIVCVLRYKRHYYMATGTKGEAAAAEFLQHATEEQLHADQISARIVQLGGEPDLSPEGLATRSHSEYVAGETLADMVREDLIAERIAIDLYAEMIRYLGEDDPTTRRMLEEILAVEEEHADDMRDLLGDLGGTEKTAI